MSGRTTVVVGNDTSCEMTQALSCPLAVVLGRKQGVAQGEEDQGALAEGVDHYPLEVVAVVEVRFRRAVEVEEGAHFSREGVAEVGHCHLEEAVVEEGQRHRPEVGEQEWWTSCQWGRSRGRRCSCGHWWGREGVTRHASQRRG